MILGCKELGIYTSCVRNLWFWEKKSVPPTTKQYYLGPDSYQIS